MSKNQHTYLDLSNSKSLKEILPNQPSLSSQEAGWRGFILRYFDRLPPDEFSEYHPQQHLVIVHQRAKSKKSQTVTQTRYTIGRNCLKLWFCQPKCF